MSISQPAEITTAPRTFPPILQSAANWILLYVLRPLGQILLFIAISIAIMSVIAITIGIVFRTPWHGISILYTRPKVDLLNQVLIQLPNMIVDGITIGFVYALIALGYTMVYGVLQFVNFAHSEVFMVGGVVGYEILKRLDDAKALGSINPVILILGLIVAAMIVSGVLAVVIERLAYKPLRSAPRLVPLISAIGVSFILQDLVRAFELVSRGENYYPYPTDAIAPVNGSSFLTQTVKLFTWFQIGGRQAQDVTVNYAAIFVIFAAILILLGLNYFVNATKIGKGIRAVSQDQGAASLMGINVSLMISITFLIGGALGGAAGILFGLKTTLIRADIGFIPGIKAFTAAVLGGIGNITGALLGGILLGLLEAFASALLPYFPALGTGYTNIIAFAILILILIFRPSGLLGKRVDEKV